MKRGGITATVVPLRMISSDVKELVDIVVAYKISIKRVNECRSFAYRQEKMLKWKLEHELDVGIYYWH